MRELDPEFALQSRLSYGRHGVYAWVAVAAALFVGFGGASLSMGLSLGFAQAGAFLILAALPYGAIQVRGLERRGQLDSRRLTGRPPVTLGLALVGGSAWAFLVSGGLLLATAAVTGYAYPAFTLAALLAMGLTVAALVLLLPPSTTLDNWVLLVLLFFSAVSTVQLMGADRRGGTALGVIVVSAIVCPWALPLAIRRMQGVPHSPAGPTRRLVARLVDLRTTSRPEFARALMASATALDTAALMGVAGTLAIVWLTRRVSAQRRDILEVLVVFGPLVLAGYDAAARIHHEHVTGALDRVRLSGQRAWRVLFDTVFALSGPFVAVSMICAAALAVFDPENAGILAAWPVAAGLVVFGPLVGALRGRKPGVFLAVSILAVPTVARLGPAGIVGAIAVAGTVGLAINSLDRGGGVRLETWKAAAGAALLAAVFASMLGRMGSGLPIAGMLALSIGVLFPGRERVPGRTILACAAAAAVAAGIAEYYWVRDQLVFQVTVTQIRTTTYYYPDYRGGAGRALYAGVTGLHAAFGVIGACCALNQFRDRPRASMIIRAAPLAAAAVFFTALTSSMAMLDANDAFMARYRYNGFAILEMIGLAVLGAAVALLVRREVRGTRRPS